METQPNHRVTVLLNIALALACVASPYLHLEVVRWVLGWPGDVLLVWALLCLLMAVSPKPEPTAYRRSRVLAALAVMLAALLVPVLLFLPEWPQSPLAVWHVFGTALATGLTPWWLCLLAGVALCQISLSTHMPRMLRVWGFAAGLGCLATFPKLIDETYLVHYAIPWWIWLGALMFSVKAVQPGRYFLGFVVLFAVCMLVNEGLKHLWPAASHSHPWFVFFLTLSLPIWFVWIWRINRFAQPEPLTPESAQPLASTGSHPQPEPDIRDLPEMLAAALPDPKTDPEGFAAELRKTWGTSEGGGGEADPAPQPQPQQLGLFDLQAHLDSPAAQEAADKYTRE